MRLYQIKCLYGLSNKGCEAVLQLFSHGLPKGHCIPNSLEKVQKVIRDLGFEYQRIDACIACINHCVLYQGENADLLDLCPTCQVSRWKSANHDDPDMARMNSREKKCHVEF